MYIPEIFAAHGMGSGLPSMALVPALILVLVAVVIARRIYRERLEQKRLRSSRGEFCRDGETGACRPARAAAGMDTEEAED